MKRILLIPLTFFYLTSLAQKKQQLPQSESYKIGRRIGGGGALVAIGGASIAGSILVSADKSNKDNSSTVKGLAIFGGASLVLGGIFISTAGNRILKGNKPLSGLTFTGNSIVYNF